MRDLFEQTADRLFRNSVGPETLIQAEAGEWPSALWDEVEQNGLNVAATPEEHGGVGGSLHDIFVLVRAAGHHCAPIPLGEALLANWLLGACGREAITDPLSIGIARDATLDARFSGSVVDVPWGRHVGVVATVVDATLLLLPAGDASIDQNMNIAREPRDTLVFSNAAPIASTPLPKDFPADIVLLSGAMVRSAQIAGALRRILETAVDYANQRVQFGKPIGKFQAIQHQIAILAEHAAIAGAAADAAFGMANPAPSLLPAASAKAVAAEASGGGAAIAHSVLGAIGFTYEHALHFATRRLWSWRDEFGSQAYWSKQLGGLASAGGSPAFWPSLTRGAFPTEQQV